MRSEIFVRVISSSLAIKFYVDELAMFEIAADYGMNDFLLRATRNPNFGLQISERTEQTVPSPLFGMAVESCDAEFGRLNKTDFKSGGRLVPDKDGKLSIFEWPGGKSFLVEDPSGNQILLFEDRIAP